MKLCSGFTNDPDVLGMLSCVFIIYFTAIVNLLNANG